jgi:hypothetical protein
VALVWALGCTLFPKAGNVPEPVSEADVARASAKWPPGVSQESLQAGRAQFMAKCNHCHDYPDLRAIDEPDWPSIVKRMGQKAQLSPQDVDNVLHFILVARERRPE